MQAEVLELKSEYNQINAEAEERKAKFKALLESVSAEKMSSPGRQEAKPAFLQHQLWLIEQAWHAEKKYRKSLDGILAQVTSASHYFHMCK